MDTLYYSGTLTVVTCWCGMRHAVPQELRQHQERQHADGCKQNAIYCPLGHTHIIAGQSEAERLRERLARERQRADANRDLLRDTERRLAAQKGATTRAKRRAGAGVCPCCNRTFKQLASHMQNKHPDFDPAGREREGTDV